MGTERRGGELGEEEVVWLTRVLSISSEPGLLTCGGNAPRNDRTDHSRCTDFGLTFADVQRGIKRVLPICMGSTWEEGRKEGLGSRGPDSTEERETALPKEGARGRDLNPCR